MIEKIKMIEKYVVDAVSRLDVFLAKVLEISRNQAQLLIETSVYVNGQKPSKAGVKLQLGDVITIDRNLNSHESIVPKNIHFDIIYEDEDIIVVNKPRGLVVHPAVGHPDDTLANALAYHYQMDQEMASDENRMGIVHRIDKDTSGLLLVAKNPKAKKNLSDQIKNHQVDREYLCLAYGYFRDAKFKVVGAIARNEYDRKKMAVDVEKGKKATTHFTLVRQFKNVGLLSCKLETGRTHQIRVHLSFINHPIVGDSVYGTKKIPFADQGQVLHAYKISFTHPISGKKMVFYAPIDDYFKMCLSRVIEMD